MNAKEMLVPEVPAQQAQEMAERILKALAGQLGENVRLVGDLLALAKIAGERAYESLVVAADEYADIAYEVEMEQLANADGEALQEADAETADVED